VNEYKLLVDVKESQNVSVGQLVKIGRQKGYVTYDDVFLVVPEAEQDLKKLEVIISTLRNSGVSVKDDVNREDYKRNGRKKKGEVSHLKENRLDNIETDDLVGIYFQEAGKHDLLTIQEEVKLAKQIERGRKARRELSKPELSLNQIRELQNEVNVGWMAMEKLITSNSRLVISIGKKYMGQGVSFLDLIQEGNIGLMRAAKKFDYRRGYKFSTYATWWIRQAVTRSLADQSRTIRIPVHMSEKLSKMFKIQHQLRQRLGRNPTKRELAAEMEIPVPKINAMFKTARHTLSLDMPIKQDEDAELGDFIQDNETPDPEFEASQSLLAQNLSEAMETLPPREARVLQLRHGIPHGEKHTLNEIGKKLGVTRERIRQIEYRGLQRLRSRKIISKLRSYIIGI
jgi:RNA polymerase primary sigma factor